MPINEPVKVDAIVAFDNKTVTDTKAENDRNHATQEGIRKATWSAVVAATIYALITIGMWVQMAKQNKIARDALRQSETQWKSQQAPLLGIENNAISIAPNLNFAWAPPLPTPTIWVGPITYVIKNFGAGSALHEWDLVHIFPNPDGKKPDPLIKALCPIKPTTAGEAAEGQFFPPGAEVHAGETTSISRTLPNLHIVSMWIEVCLSYEDSWKTVHHSRFVYMTLPGPGNGAGAITPIPTHPDWTYVPIKGLALISAETDYGENPN